MDFPVPPLSPRLAALAEAIPAGSRIADVGSDHGLLPLWLAANGRAAYCLATEKTPGLLLRVARPQAAAPWAGLLDYRAGDGLAAVHPADRIDTIVLAGLGGRTIIRLLDSPQLESPFLARLVLQPRSEFARTRLGLAQRGWRPVIESLTRERGRFHLTLTAERGDDVDLYRHATLSRDDLLTAGPLLTRARPPELTTFWQSERNRLSSIVAGSRSGPSSARAGSDLARAERILAAISTPGG